MTTARGKVPARQGATLVGLVFGHMAAQVVAIAAGLGLADRVGDG